MAPLRSAVFAALGILSAADILSIALTVLPGAQLAGAPLHVSYIATFSPGDNANLSSHLVPYFDGAQYGAEVGFFSASGSTASGNAWLAVPWSLVPPTSVQLAAQGPFADGPSMGTNPPTGAVLSNAATLTVQPRAPVRPHTPAPNETLFSLAWEPWFTPLNFFWQATGGGPHGAGLAEAIPSIGRYASVNLMSLRAHAAQFIQAGVDVLLVDWTNQLWTTPTFADRHPNTQEIFNSTQLAFGVYAGLRAEGWSVPRFLLLLGLDNGPTTPLPALAGELDFMASALLGNSTAGGAESFVSLDGRPLVIIFDGTGADHTGYSHPNFTIRWMASQLQSTPDFARRGYWSWMDATLQPVITIDAGVAEATTLAPSFFAAGGWLNSALAAGRSGGLTLLLELANLLAATAGRARALPAFVNICQWNEFAGTPQSAAPGTTYADSYSPDLSNDLEPTSPWGCAYQRPGGVRCGGGWGYAGLNALAAARAALVNPTALNGSTALFIVAPAVGSLANYSAPQRVTVTFVAARFDADSLFSGGEFLRNVSLPVAVAVDGAPVASLPAPAAPGLQSFDLDTSALDDRFPHVLTLTALPSPSDGGAHLTRWPLAFDTVDADAGAPLATPVPASATAWLWLPESQLPIDSAAGGRQRASLT